MKTRGILVVTICAMMCVSAKAQEAKSLYIGVSPIGTESVKLSFKNDKNAKFKYKYKSYMNYNLSYEKQGSGFGYMCELSYSRAKFDEIEIKENLDELTPEPGKDVYTAGAALYALQTINKGKRFQVPLYAGLGVDYINGGPFHHITPFLGLKARVKYYLTYKIGIFVAGTYKFGYGGSKEHGNLYPSTGYLDAGLIIGLN